MNTVSSKSWLSGLRVMLWPIEKQEYKKFVPMALMMFFILLNYSTLRSIKDGFVVVSIGAEALSFLKTYIVLPCAIIAMVSYIKLCNIMSTEKVFYAVTTFFLVYLTVFTFFLYPYHMILHANPDDVDALSALYPNFKWFIRIGGKWVYATFYTISELWGTMMLSLLFWQFANRITKTEEAKRFYSMFGLLANLSLPITALILGYFLSDTTQLVTAELKFIPVLLIVIFSGLMIMVLYRWINQNVLTDINLYNPSATKAKKSKAKLSILDSLKMIMGSKYLGLIAILVISYGISINIVEGVWKAKIKELYPTQEAYTMFMGEFQAWQGIAAICFMLIGSNILRKVSWKTAAIFTPLMILVTGIAFFSFVFFEDNVVANYLTVFLGVTPLMLAVIMGTIQNVLSKGTKYSLFDSTKEMAYIPLDTEMQTKGKAAVEVIGGRFGKSGGGVIQSSVFMLLPSFSFNEAIPFFALIFFLVVTVWLFAVKFLSKEYQTLMTTTSNEKEDMEKMKIAAAA